MRRLCYQGHGFYTTRRCAGCEQARERARPTAAQRGYDATHRAARATLKAELPASCRCGVLLTPEGDWVAAHVVDGHPEYGWRASCRSCNEKDKRRVRRAPRTRYG